MLKSYAGLQLDDVTQDFTTEVWKEIATVVNCAGIFGYGTTCAPKYHPDYVNKTVNKYNNFILPTQFINNYLSGYTFAFSSSLHSHHQYIHISFKITREQQAANLAALLNCDGLITDKEVLFTIRLPAKIAGDDLWQILDGLQERVREDLGPDVILAGKPSYLRFNGTLAYDRTLVLFPDLRRRAARNRLIRGTALNFEFIARIALGSSPDFNLVNTSPQRRIGDGFEPTASSSTYASASEADGELQEVTTRDLQSSNNPVRMTNTNSNSLPDSNALTHKSSTETYSGTSVVGPMVQDEPRPSSRTVENRALISEKRRLTGPLQSSQSEALRTSLNIYYVLVQLAEVFKVLSNNELRISIGTQKNRGKSIPRYINADQFAAHSLAWFICVNNDAFVSSAKVKEITSVVIAAHQFKCKHDFAIQTWVKNLWIERNVIIAISNSYSVGNYSKQYELRIDNLNLPVAE